MNSVLKYIFLLVKVYLLYLWKICLCFHWFFTFTYKFYNHFMCEFCVFVHAHVLSGLTLCDPMDYSPPGSFVHRIFQARILEWAAISYSKGIFPTQRSNSSYVPALAGRFFFLPTEPLGKSQKCNYLSYIALIL